MKLSRTPTAQQWAIIKNILPLLTDGSITEWTIHRLEKQHFNSEIINNLKVIQTTYESNQKTFEEDIERGVVSKLPPSEPYAASKFVFERAITEPMGDINFCLVFDDEDQLKGYRIAIDGIPLDVWCAKHQVNPNDYLLVLSIYFEDMLQAMDIKLENGQFVNINDGMRLDSKTLLQSLHTNQKNKQLASDLNSKGFLFKDKALSFDKFELAKEPTQKPSEQLSAGPVGS